MYFVDNAEGPDPNPVSRSPGEFLATSRTGIIGKLPDSFNDPLLLR